MKPVYVSGIAPETVPADRGAGRPMTEDEMLLDMEIRLAVAARDGRIEIDDGTWWRLEPAGEGDGPSQTTSTDAEHRHKPDSAAGPHAFQMNLPRTGLTARGPEETARSLGIVAELAMHARIMKDGIPDEFKTGNREADVGIGKYIAAAAGNLTETLAKTGRYEPSQSDVPEDQREAMFIDLEYFDEMIRDKHGKSFTEKDACRAAADLETKHFDPATSPEAAAAWQRTKGPQTPSPVRGSDRPVGGGSPAAADERGPAPKR